LENERFEIKRLLGRGGMGVVYQARDHHRDEDVALKTLIHLDADTLFRFKREFRSLAGVTHPNLVQLYELFSVSGDWYFTMELLAGVDFLTHVRGEASVKLARATTGGEARASAPATERTRVGRTARTKRAASVGKPAQPELLVPALAHLVEGLLALHDSGHLHRDIKPSNVLITPEGRVVILDFGVATAIGAPGRDVERDFAGTPTYMAPEQASDGHPTTASDLYAVGCVLYEALTGRAPFTGSPDDVVTAKLTRDAPHPREIVANVPAWLDEVCVSLLQPDPARRMDGASLLRSLNVRTAPRPVDSSARVRDDWSGDLIGRARHLDELTAALARVRRGDPECVAVHGRSGMGKTALVEQFLADAAEQGAIVLRGRCYERESVPYKALDSLVDSIVTHLRGIGPKQAAALVPDDVAALCCAFPVLRRIPGMADADLGPPRVQRIELRRRAFRGLLQMLRGIALTAPTVLFIDDLQWGDIDSAPLLKSLVVDADAPLLLVLSYRSEEAAELPVLREIFDRTALADESRLRHVNVSRLAIGDAGALAARLLGGAAPQMAERIARESGGNPFFVRELARYALTATTPDPTLSLHAVLGERCASVSDDAHKLLQAVAVAGVPLPRGLAWEAAGLQGSPTRALAELSNANLVRASGGREADRIEAYHDRVRETVAASLAPERARELHVNIARAIEASPNPDVEQLALHFAAARQHAPAIRYALLAAHGAFAAFAFESAARWYGIAVELLRETGDLRPEILERWAEALGSAGMGRQAAAAYREAASSVAGDHSLALRAHAAGELLRSGHVDDGIDELDPALAGAGLALPVRPWRCLMSLLAGRLRLWFRGLRFRQRSERELAPAALTRIDLCWEAACGLSLIDMIRGAVMQTRHLLLALRAGEPIRLGRALTLEVGYHCVDGPRAAPRVSRVLDALERLATDTEAPVLRGLHPAASGLASYQFGHWRHAKERAEVGEYVLREECTGVHWELTTTRLYLLWSLYYLGELDELRRRVIQFRDEARQCGDQYAWMGLSLGLAGVTDLADGDVSRSRHVATVGIAAWSKRGFHVQHYWALVSLAHCDLYEGDAAAAYERVVREWPSLRKSLLLRVHTVRTEALHLRARCALAAAAAGAEGDALRDRAARDARRISRERQPWADGLAAMIRAAVSYHRSGDSAAIAELTAAESRFEAADMKLFKAMARWRRGELAGGADGARLRDEAEAELRRRAVRDPAAFTRTFAPGFDVAR
jgi:serine/threonine protein kinase